MSGHNIILIKLEYKSDNRQLEYTIIVYSISLNTNISNAKTEGCNESENIPISLYRFFHPNHPFRPLTHYVKKK